MWSRQLLTRIDRSGSPCLVAKQLATKAGDKLKVRKAGGSLVDKLNSRVSGLPETLGFQVTDAERGRIYSKMKITSRHLAANGYCHAGSMITLADTSCGYGTFASLPEGANGFTTVELKSNFLGTALSGEVTCEAQCMHMGKTTQVWDATVFSPEGKKLSLFRCTQLILYK
mmetsp:Transcript_5520/g.16480  ORF Transcript_5520/g.16480 Transcript_5520/m.16480 type:complete len:171 (-) Transcript_5520:34-546(-)